MSTYFLPRPFLHPPRVVYPINPVLDWIAALSHVFLEHLTKAAPSDRLYTMLVRPMKVRQIGTKSALLIY